MLFLRTLSAGLLLLLAGCASSGVFPSAHLTDVRLAEGNFRVVATDVAGEATAAYLVGISASIFSEMRTIALARIDGTGRLYGEAISDLWSNFEQAHGPVAGRSLALVNVRFDADAVNFLVYTRPTISVRADVVEFAP